MIQRIQSVYLSLTTVLSLLFLNGTFLKFINNTGSDIQLKFTGIWKNTGESGLSFLQNHLLLSAVLILIPVLSVAALLAFRDRKLQTRITKGLILTDIILIGLIIYSAYSIINNYQAEVIPGYKMFIPVLILILGILALRGIRKDEDLVKSYDRLR